MTSSNQGYSSKWREPLAYRMMFTTLTDFIGQRHILLREDAVAAITADRLSSILLFIAGRRQDVVGGVIAQSTSSQFRKLNAVTSGVADIKAVISDTENPILTPSDHVLFIDEIHRFNKAQQDALLPSVESGRLILIGATTENPFFHVNKALVSRSTVFQMYPLTRDDILEIMRRAIGDEERGLGSLSLEVDDETLGMIADLAGGDARVALNGIELAAMTTSPDERGVITVTREIVVDSMQKKIARYDRDGEQHYDNISAMIKSMRGSDPDAAVLYLARALEGGEDLNFLGRRIVIAAAEDVGLANPQMLSIALSAWQASVMVGLPEARIILSEAVIALATSPKSNSAYLAINEAMADVSRRDTGEIPFHIRNAPVSGMEELGYAKGYEYSHDYPSAVSGQTFLPEESSDAVYYRPKEIGYEKRIIDWMNYVESLRRRLRQSDD